MSSQKEYLIYRELPCHVYGGGQNFGAFQTFGKRFREICDSLPTDVADYARYDAPNKREAVAEARRRWADVQHDLH